MFARLGQLALLSERHAQVVVGIDEVRLEAQRLTKVLDRLGQPALLSERSAPVVVGRGIVRSDLQGLPVMLARLGQPALPSERSAPVVVSYWRLGIDGEGMGPERLRVMPDLDLVPVENSQPHDDT